MRASTWRLIQLSDIGLVYGTVTESALICALVDDHGVFHVVAGVGDNGNHSVGAVRVLPKVVVTVFLGLNEGLLREEDPVDLVVHAVGVVVVGRAHGLLGHLALIHVTRRLVVLGEGLHGGDD